MSEEDVKIDIQEVILKAHRLPPQEAIEYLESHMKTLEDKRGELEVEIYKLTDEMARLNKEITRINNFINDKGGKENVKGRER